MSVVIASATAALVTVGRTLAVCLCGFGFARFRVRAGGVDTWRDLARLNAEFLMPCLCFATFIEGIDATTIRNLWPVPVLAVALPCVWLGVGAIGARLLLAKDQQQFVVFAATTVAFNNGFAIPYPLLLGLSPEVEWLSKRDRVDEFSASVCILWSFVVLLQIWTVAFYLYGRQSAREAAAAETELLQPTSPAQTAAEVDTPDAVVVACPRDATAPGSADDSGAPALAAVDGKDCMQDGPCAAEVDKDRQLQGQEDKAQGLPGELGGGARRRSSGLSAIGFSAVAPVSLSSAGWCRALREVLNPLVLSLIVSMAIALSPLRSWLLDSSVHQTFHFIGSASVPLVLVQMGAGMARVPPTGGNGLRLRSAAVIVLLRLVVANLVGSGIVTAFRHAGWVTDPHVALCLYLQCCSPTAANVMLVSSMQGAYVQPMAVLLFVMQLAAVPVLAISIAAYVAALS